MPQSAPPPFTWREKEGDCLEEVQRGKPLHSPSSLSKAATRPWSLDPEEILLRRRHQGRPSWCPLGGGRKGLFLGLGALTQPDTCGREDTAEAGVALLRLRWPTEMTTHFCQASKHWGGGGCLPSICTALSRVQSLSHSINLLSSLEQHCKAGQCY